MINLRVVIPFLLPAVLLVLGGCKLSRTPGHSVKIPESFSGGNDSVNSASINWKQFFADSFLLGLIDTALHNNFDARVAFQRIEMARSNVQLTKAAMFPTVNAYTAYNHRRFGLYTMDGAGNITTPIEGEKIVPINLPDYYIGLQTSWEMDIWGQLRSRKAAALSRYLASVEGKNFVITNLISELASAYYDLLSYDTQLDIVRENIKLLEDAFELTKIQMQTGVTSQLAVEQFEAQLLNSRAFEKEVRQNILETESEINFLLGRFPQPVFRDKTRLFSSIAVSPKVGIPSDLLRYRPDIRQAEFELIAADADVRSAKAAFLPAFNITGAYGFQAYRAALLFTTPQSIAYNFLGGLTAPLINRNAIKSEFKFAKAAQLEALYNYQQRILNAYVEVYNQLANIQNLEDVFLLKSRQAEILNGSIETSFELFKARRATYLEVILSQRNSLEAKLELVAVKKRQLSASLDLYKALGGGWTP